MRKCAAVLIAVLGVGTALAGQQTNETIIVHYVDRPPYVISQTGKAPEGAVATPAALAFKKAGIPFTWEKTPLNRQFAILRENQGFDCIIGVEKIASREAFANFTEPLYISQPFVAMVNSKIKVKSGVSLDEMLSKYMILAKENYTQGDQVTERIMKSPNKYVTSATSKQMVEMIARGRADFMMISNDEIAYYVQNGVLSSKDIQVIKLSDVDIRFARRVMCSKKVGVRIIERLNRAIAAMNVKPAPFTSLEKLPIKN